MSASLTIIVIQTGLGLLSAIALAWFTHRLQARANRHPLAKIPPTEPPIAAQFTRETDVNYIMRLEKRVEYLEAEADRMAEGHQRDIEMMERRWRPKDDRHEGTGA